MLMRFVAFLRAQTDGATAGAFMRYARRYAYAPRH